MRFNNPLQSKNFERTTSNWFNEGSLLPLREPFNTSQGEGRYFQGNSAYFIRPGGCDVGCVWCDLKSSWEAGDWPLVPVG